MERDPKLTSSERKARPARKIIASEFLLTDPAGQTCARLGVDSQRQPALSMFSSTGAVRLTMGLEDGLPQVLLNDEAEITRAAIRVKREGGAHLTMRDRAGKDRAIIGTGDEGDATIQVLGAEGELRAEIATDLDGETTLILYGPDTQPRIAMLVADSHSTVLAIDDPSGNTAIMLGATEDGDRKIVVMDTAGRPSVFAGIESGEASLGVLEEEDEPEEDGEKDT